MMRKSLVLAVIGMAISACTPTTIIPSKLEPPSARLLSPPEPLPDIKPGDDLYQENARLRASYGRETAKVTWLQKYVRIILKKQANQP